MRLKWMAAAALAVFSIAGIFIYSSWAGAQSDTAPVAEVNGTRITPKEFKRALDSQRAPVIDYFYRSHGAEYGSKFWETDYNGENPEATAKKWAMEAAVRTKVELELARRHGLIRGTSYDDLIREMNRENKQRQAAVKAGQPVYGPVQLDEDTFMNYYLSKLRTQLKEKLSGDELRISEEDLERHYERVKDKLFPMEDRIKFHKISLSYREAGQLQQEHEDHRKKLAAKQLLDAVKGLLEQGKGTDEAVSELQAGNAAAAIRYTEEELNRNTAGTYFKSQPVLYSALTGSLKIHSVSPVLDEAMLGEYVLIKVLEKETNGNISLEEKIHEVRKSYLDEAYTSYLNKLVDAARVDIFKSSYDRIVLR